jgi:hypothetical protein
MPDWQWARAADSRGVRGHARAAGEDALLVREFRHTQRLQVRRREAAHIREGLYQQQQQQQ